MDLSSSRDWGRGQAYRACNDCMAGQHTDSVGEAEYSDAMRCDDRARPAITRMTPAEYCLAKLQVPARSHTSWNVGHSNNRDSSLCSYWTLRRSPQSHQQLSTYVSSLYKLKIISTFISNLILAPQSVYWQYKRFKMLETQLITYFHLRVCPCVCTFCSNSKKYPIKSYFK